MLVISLSGNIGSGKDTICSNLIEHLEKEHSLKCKRFFFADKLKEFCVEVLGLDYNLVHGTQEDKDTYTDYKWEDMPGVVITPNNLINQIPNFTKLNFGFDKNSTFITHTAGQMTIREILQFFGTEICRKMYNNVWVDSLIRQINNSSCDVAIITDTRFHNEMNALKNTGAILIRLSRKAHSIGLEHHSELELSTYSNYDYILDNKNMSRAEQKNEVITFIEKYIVHV